MKIQEFLTPRRIAVTIIAAMLYIGIIYVLAYVVHRHVVNFNDLSMEEYVIAILIGIVLVFPVRMTIFRVARRFGSPRGVSR